MLRKLTDLKGFAVVGKSEDLGTVSDFYFDQQHFILRYLVIDTGSWLQKEKTLLSTAAFTKIDFANSEIQVDLTKPDLEAGPSLEKNKPVSKQMEEKMAQHFDWPLYWTMPDNGPAIQAGTVLRRKLFDFNDFDQSSMSTSNSQAIESNLRSFAEVHKYHIQALDKEFGHLTDLFVDEENWLIRYLLIDTRNILPGKDVLIAPEWIQNISWNQKKIFISKTKAEIKSAPPYQEQTAKDLVERSYEKELYEHYNEEKYWLR
jgi:hypothetical protein